VSTLNKNLDVKKFDTRLIEWNLQNGIITKEELEKHLASLEDSEAKAEYFKLVNSDEKSSN
tara:strand:+ start:55 stop:237 length:183 start_codon:yes stop_codon:yes gene_type:complete